MVGSEQRPIHPLRVIGTVRDVFPRDATVAIDVGVLAQGMGGAFPYFKVLRAALLHRAIELLRHGLLRLRRLPVAKLVYPDRPAVGFVGDGSFQMIMNVLPTAAEHKLPVTWCVLNDGALGSIWDGQRAGFGNRIIATTFETQPDFATHRRGLPVPWRAGRRSGRGPAGARARARRERPRRPGGDRLHRREGTPRRQRRILRQALTKSAKHRETRKRHAIAQFRPADGRHHPGRLYRARTSRTRWGFHGAPQIGPWFVSGPFVPPEGIYRGQSHQHAADARSRIFRAHELRVDRAARRAPSVYQEVIRSRGYGFHHWGMPTDDLDGEVARYAEVGYPAGLFRPLAAWLPCGLCRHLARSARHGRVDGAHARARGPVHRDVSGFGWLGR